MKVIPCILAEIQIIVESYRKPQWKKNKKIGLICSSGGHLVEVLQLLGVFEGNPYFLLI